MSDLNKLEKEQLLKIFNEISVPSETGRKYVTGLQLMEFGLSTFVNDHPEMFDREINQDIYFLKDGDHAREAK